MSKQEEIRSWLSKEVFQQDEGFECTDFWWAEMCDGDWSNAIVCSEKADKILTYLHSQDVRLANGESLVGE